MCLCRAAQLVKLRIRISLLAVIFLTVSIAISGSTRAAPQEGNSPSGESRDIDAASSAYITVTSVPPAASGTGVVSRYGLTRQDLQAITETLSGLQCIVPVREVRRTARFGDQAKEIILCGTIPDFLKLYRLSVQRGQFLNSQDEEQMRSVAVLGSRVARDLFHDQDPVGKNIRIGRHYFVVIGTVAGQGGAAEQIDSHVFVPLSTMRTRLGDQELDRHTGSFSLTSFELTRIEILLQDVAAIAPTAAQLEQLLDHLHEDRSYAVSHTLATPNKSQK